METLEIESEVDEDDRQSEDVVENAPKLHLIHESYKMRM